MLRLKTRLVRYHQSVKDTVTNVHTMNTTVRIVTYTTYTPTIDATKYMHKKAHRLRSSPEHVEVLLQLLEEIVFR
jgi:hypothetical protein